MSSANTTRERPVTAAPDTCGVNIRGVPKAVWQRARANALQSGLPFKVYVIKLLERSEPIPPQLPGAPGTSQSEPPDGTPPQTAH